MSNSFSITNMPEFNKALKDILRKNKSMQREIITKVSFDGLRELQRATPKDTSRAAASWNNTVDRHPSEWKQPKGREHYSLKHFKDRNKITSTSRVNLSNNVEYIIPLEHGHSKQRKYFVRDTVAALTEQLRGQVRKESARNVK